MLDSWKKSYDKPRQYIKKQRHHFANKGLYSQSYGFSSNHIWMWEMGHKEDWAPKNWCFQIGKLENTLESPLDIMEIKPVNPKGSQPWIFIGRIDAEAEAPNTSATWCEEPTYWKRTWYWERLEVEERGHIVWDGWMALPTQWTWVWANSWKC